MTSKALDNFPKKSTSVLRYGYKPADPFIPAQLDGLFGIEIELEGDAAFPRVLPRPRTRVNSAAWQWKEDGSLRSGCEYVTSTAIHLADVLPMCQGLYDELREVGANIVLSSRCSTHVHVNMQGQRVNTLCSFVTLWAMFEEILVNWCGPGRVGNLFCLRLQDCGWAVREWIAFFKTGVYRFNSDNKYLALNASRLINLGTLEIRTLEGCNAPDRIVKWVEALDRIREKAVHYATPTDIANDLSAYGARAFFEHIFEGLSILPELIGVSEEEYGLDLQTSVLEGFRRIQPATNSLPWGRLLPLFGRMSIPDPFAPDERVVARRGEAGRMFEVNLDNGDAPQMAPPEAPRNDMEQEIRENDMEQEIREAVANLERQVQVRHGAEVRVEMPRMPLRFNQNVWQVIDEMGVRGNGN